MSCKKPMVNLSRSGSVGPENSCDKKEFYITFVVIFIQAFIKLIPKML